MIKELQLLKFKEMMNLLIIWERHLHNFISNNVLKNFAI